MNTQYDLPKNYYFGGGGGTIITPLALVLLLIALALILWVPRKRVLVVLLSAGILIPASTSIVIFGFHFPALRALIGVVWLRFAVRRDFQFPQLQLIDKLFLAWALSNAVTYSLVWGHLGAVTNRAGFLWTNLGVYFALRVLIRERRDAMLAVKTLAILVLILAPAMAWEHTAGRNLFAILGAPPISSIRYGKIRAEGPFEHAIIAGTVGAILLPLLVGMWQVDRKQRILAGLAIVGSLLMILASSSSTPLMAGLAGGIAMLAISLRNRLSLVRWTFLLSIISLQLFMKAPIWFLIAKLSHDIGGSGYHRAMLIDTMVRHFWDWWLIGTRHNVSWGYDMWDVDNAFVAAGVEGGLLTLMLFIGIFVCAFRHTGASLRKIPGYSNTTQLVWSIGACIFANLVGFFGIVYFDQSIMIWYCILAMSVATISIAGESREVDVPRTMKIPAASATFTLPAAAQVSAKGLEL